MAEYCSLCSRSLNKWQQTHGRTIVLNGTIEVHIDCLQQHEEKYGPLGIKETVLTIQQKIGGG